MRQLHPALVLVMVCLVSPAAAQEQEPLRLPLAAASNLILGAANRFVVPDSGTWRLQMAPAGVVFTAGAFFRDGPTVVAGTTGSGLYVVRPSRPPIVLTTVDGLASNVVTAVAGDGKRVFVGTDGGLAIWDGTTFLTMTPHNSALPGSVVTGLQVASGGGCWVGTARGGAFVDSAETLVPWPSGAGAPPGPAIVMADWPRVGMAVVHSNVLFVLANGRWTSRRLGQTVTAMLALPEGGLLLAGPRGLHYLASGDDELRQVATIADVSSLALVEGTVWVSARSGVKVAGTTNELGIRPATALAPAGQAVSVTDSSFRGVLHRGSQLLAYNADGLFFRDERGWQRLWPVASQPAQGLRAVAAAPDGALFLATDGGRLFFGLDGQWSELQGGRQLSGLIQSLAVSTDGRTLTVLTDDGSLVELPVR